MRTNHQMDNTKDLFSKPLESMTNYYTNKDIINYSSCSPKMKIFLVNNDTYSNNHTEPKKASFKRKLYHCKFCSKGYSSITRFEVHQRTHTGEKPFNCSYCNKKFNEKGNLKAHIRIHTGERPYPCRIPGCSMAFKTQGQLKDHNFRHLNLRPFKCTQCSSAFNRKTRLKVHMMIHTGEKPFKCPYPDCTKTFREKGNLKTHYKKHTPLLINNEEKVITISNITRETSIIEDEQASSASIDVLKYDDIFNTISDFDYEPMVNNVFQINELNYVHKENDIEEDNLHLDLNHHY